MKCPNCGTSTGVLFKCDRCNDVRCPFCKPADGWNAGPGIYCRVCKRGKYVDIKKSQSRGANNNVHQNTTTNKHTGGNDDVLDSIKLIIGGIIGLLIKLISSIFKIIRPIIK